MKTERRHELQHNWLADWMGNHAKNLGAWGKIVMAAVLLFFAVYFITTAMRASKTEAAAKSWDQFRMASSEQDILGLRELADEYPGTQAAGWGLQTAGDLGLATGSMAMYGNREVAEERLDAARDDYEGALRIAQTPLLKQRALLGLAQTHEARNDFKAAKECYERILRNWPDTAVANTAQSRLTFLDQPSTQSFYDWFTKQEIDVPPPAPLGGNIKPPSVYGDLPSNPGLQLPNVDELDESNRGGGEDLTPPESGSSESGAK